MALLTTFVVALITISLLLIAFPHTQRKKRSIEHKKKSCPQAPSYNQYYQTTSGKILRVLKPREDIGHSNSC